MRSILFCAILSIAVGFQHIHAQDDFIIPPSVKIIDYANRQLTFSEVTMNGKETTYLEVEKGETCLLYTSDAADEYQRV